MLYFIVVINLVLFVNNIYKYISTELIILNFNGFTKKIAIIGTGFVGMSFAYALLCDGGCDEIVLIDIDKKKAEGEAMDLSHGLAFAKTNMKIYAGSYSDCRDADIAVICAGVSQKSGEDRISLLQRNTEVFKSIISPVIMSGFDGIFLIATNPVDIMTSVTQRLSGFDCRRVIGSGTTLDTARLRYLLGQYFSVDPKNVHAYVIGEHGDSEITPWSQAFISTKSIDDLINSNSKYSREDVYSLSAEVTTAAQRIIEAKKATYYGIGMSLVRIVRTILFDEKSVLTVSVMLRGEYGEENVYAGVPSVICKDGVKDIITLSLTDEELDLFKKSCQFLKKTTASLKI